LRPLQVAPVESNPESLTPTPATASPGLELLSLPARMEAILYLKGKPLSLGELADIAGIGRDAAEMALITLMADYAHRDTALEIRQEGQRYSLQLRDGLGDLVQNLLPVDLSTATLRTLATIALKKRILQSDLVELRGSGAYDHIKELLAQNFIERKRQSEGRSYWLSLSEKFHRTFAVRTDEGLNLSRRRRATDLASSRDETANNTDSNSADLRSSPSAIAPISDADEEAA
jgi:segregation and condensation protein B